MTFPAALFGILIASLLGVVAHLVFGGSPAKLLGLVLLAWIAFWAGHFIADKFGWQILSIGPLHVGLGVILAVLVLPVGHWLSLVRVVRPEK